MPIAVQDVIQTAARLIGLGELVTEPEASSEALLFVRCFNLIENEIALDYFPLKRTETIEPADGKILYTAFSETPVFIVGAEDAAGRKIPFEAFPAYLDVKGHAGPVSVHYAYAPKTKTPKDNTDFSGRISCRLLAYGTAAEYLLACGKFAEAAAFDKKYRDALAAAGDPRRKLSIRGRRWA